MGGRRQALVAMAFRAVDTDGHGHGLVDARDVAAAYDVARHPDYLSRRKTREQLVAELLEHLTSATASGAGSGARPGVVTWESFSEYYANVSATVDGDEYFELLVRNAWHLAGDVPYVATDTADDGDYGIDGHGNESTARGNRPVAPAAQRPPRPASATLPVPARRLHATPAGALPQPLTRFAPVNMADGADDYDGAVEHPLVDALRERLVAAGLRGFVGLQVRHATTHRPLLLRIPHPRPLLVLLCAAGVPPPRRRRAPCRAFGGIPKSLP